MMKEKTLFILGIWIICLPYLGFPVFWKNLLFVITGIFVCMIAYLMYRHKKVLLKIIDGESKNDLPHTPVNSSVRESAPIVSSFEKIEEKEKILFKSEYNPAEDAETPKVSPYSNSQSNFKTFYEEKTGPLIHRVGNPEQVDTVRPRIRAVRKKKEADTITDVVSSAYSD